MILKEYLNHLNTLAKDKPELLDLLVITASDDEGNSFNPVVYTPIAGNYNNGEFIADHHQTLNAVCLN